MWPDTERPIRLFIDLYTQWRLDATGSPTGLDYTAITTVFTLRDIPREEWSSLFDDLRVMEIEALNAMAENRSE